MFKKLWKFIKSNKILNTGNEKGNVLIVALMVITVLTFSVSSITAYSVNLASNTTNELEDVNDENEGKAKIKLAIDEFRDYIRTSEGDYTSYINVEIPIVLTNYNVTVTDETDNIEGYGVNGDKESRAFKFAYTLTDGDVLIMYCFVSNFGSTVENFNPFDYTMGTNGDLVMNSGYYDEINLFGNEVYLAGEAPYVVNGGTSQNVTPQSSEVFPVLTTSGPSTIFYNYAYKYCEGSCFITNGTADPFVFNQSNYIDVEGSALPDQGTVSEMLISDFFGTFNFNDYAVEWVRDIAPMGSRTLPSFAFADLETTVLANSSPLTTKVQGKKTIAQWPSNVDFVDITTNISYVDFQSDFKQGNKYYSMVYNGDLHITDTIKIFDDESLLIFGDLYLDATAAQNIEGALLVTGDLYIQGGMKDFEGSIMVFGETFINFDLGNGITTNGANIGFTLMAKDNIHFEEHYESHTSSAATSQITLFMYTEESIFIDAVNSRINMSGTLYARAQGNSGNNIFMEYESSAPVGGIIINSYRGYINGSGTAIPNVSDTSHGFSITVENNYNYQDRFVNIPTFDSIVVTLGEWDFFNSEFTIE